MSVTYLFLEKLHNPRFQHSPLPANLHGREFFVSHAQGVLSLCLRSGRSAVFLLLVDKERKTP